jgi:hypothetical protein
MSHGVYAYPWFRRTYGLGNLLFTWARCEIFANQHGVPMVAPQWTKPKLGPILRGERDWRHYSGIFSSRSYVHGWRRLALLSFAEQIPEKQAELFRQLPPSRRPRLIVFSEIGDFFRPLLAHRDLVHRRLLEILTTHTRRRLEEQPVDWTIAAHIRRGDMRVLRFGEEYPPRQCVATALEWFIGCVRSIRQIAGANVPVRVFSDGRDDELAPLLALPGVTRAAPNPSIVDILLLSRSPIVLTTCGSTFSGWACYLGEPVSLWYPGSLGTLMPENAAGAVVTDLEGNVSSDAVALVQQALSQKRQFAGAA